MLTIKSPITLTCSPVMTHNYTAFEERLQANYQLMQATVEPSDFLHLVSAPPEIYLGEGGMTQLLQDTDIYHIKDVQLELINNMINRIVLMEEGVLTYQDQVFISTMLRKLGIQNVDTFIRQVQNLKEEAVNTEELINLYWNHSDEIRELSLQYQEEEKQKEDKSTEEDEKEEMVLNLHQQIMDRLQTAAIYQEIRNFNTEYRRADTYLSKEELNLGEQALLAQNMLLTQLQNITHFEQEPLVYQHINTYEFASEPEEVLSTEKITKQLTEASLLNVIDRIFTVRLPQIINKEETWYPVTSLLYKVADDTIERFTQYHSQNRYNLYQTGKYAGDTIYNQNTNINVNENGTLETREYRSDHQWNTNEKNEQLEFNWNVTEEQYEENRTEQNIRLQNEINQINQRNIENQRKLLSMLVEPQEEEKNIPDYERTRREALRALSSPKDVIMEFRETVEGMEQKTETVNQEFNEILSPATREIFKTLAEYRKNPQRAVEQGLVRENADGELIRDLMYKERQMEQKIRESSTQNTEHVTDHLEYLEHTDVRHDETEQILQNSEFRHDITNKVVEQFKHTPESVHVKNVLDQTVDHIEFVHKMQEHTIDDEVLEEIINQNRNFRQQITEVNQVENIERVHENHVQTTQVREIDSQAENIARMVQQGVRSQIGSLSDQVYQRLEKRLSDERMRRGR